MVKRDCLHGYDAFQEYIKNIAPNEQLVLLFSGTKNDDGTSWCSDCREAEPVIDDVLKEIEAKSFNFVHVTVGTRDEWKNTSCPFRTDPKLKLTSIPTLILWGTERRLNDAECKKKDLVQLIFDDL